MIIMESIPYNDIRAITGEYFLKGIANKLSY